MPVAPVNTVLTDHAVAVTAGRIVALGPSAQLQARFEPRERVLRGEHALLPGFVNAHTRAAMTLLRGLPVYGPRMRWLWETVLPVEQRCMSPDFVRDGTQQAIAERLGLSQGAISAYLSRARGAGVVWSVHEEIDDAQLEPLLLPLSPGTPATARGRNQMIYQVDGDDGKVQVGEATYVFLADRWSELNEGSQSW